MDHATRTVWLRAALARALAALGYSIGGSVASWREDACCQDARMNAFRALPHPANDPGEHMWITHRPISSSKRAEHPYLHYITMLFGYHGASQGTSLGVEILKRTTILLNTGTPAALAGKLDSRDCGEYIHAVPWRAPERGYSEAM